MAKTHYQRVLETDRHLPLPMRWLTRAMSSWWTIGLLSGLVVGYVAWSHVPIGGYQLWQLRMIDGTREAALNWWPLQAAAVLLAVVIVWSAIRRLPMRWDSVGRLVLALGLAIILVSQSWAFRYQSSGVAAVRLGEAAANASGVDPLSLTYTTRMGEVSDRVLVVMIGGTMPVTVPLEGLPRWHDADAQSIPLLRLHEHPTLEAMLDFRVRITPSAYLADAKLTTTNGGKQTATATPHSQRDRQTLPYPADALLAVTFDVAPDQTQGPGDNQTPDPNTDNSTTANASAPVSPGGRTTVWLPFEPAATESQVPENFYNVAGLGQVGLSFRPANGKLPFATAAVASADKQHLGTLLIADADNDGRLLQPNRFLFSSTASTHTYRAIDPIQGDATFTLQWLSPGTLIDDPAPGRALVLASANASNPFILVGLIAFGLGCLLDLAFSWLLPNARSKTKTKAPNTLPNDPPKQNSEPEPAAT